MEMMTPITRSQDSTSCRLFIMCLLKTRPTLLAPESIVKRFRVNYHATEAAMASCFIGSRLESSI